MTNTIAYASLVTEHIIFCFYVHVLYIFRILINVFSVNSVYYCLIVVNSVK